MFHPKISSPKDDKLEIPSSTYATGWTGPQASETYDWAEAAGLGGFRTFHGRCEVALHHRHFDWPSGVTFVNYPGHPRGHKDVQIRK